LGGGITADRQERNNMKNGFHREMSWPLYCTGRASSHINPQAVIPLTIKKSSFHSEPPYPSCAYEIWEPLFPIPG
jgi:hypothetical protein